MKNPKIIELENTEPKNFEPKNFKIEELIQTGKHRQAKAEIRLLRKKGLKPLIRLQCSDWLLRIGLPNEAIKIVGTELSAAELSLADVGTLKLQARLVYMLGYFGAHKSAERVANKLIPFLDRDRDLAAQYYRFQGGNSMRIYNYQAAADNYRKSLEFLDPKADFYLYQMMRLGYADSLEGIGQSKNAIDIATDVIHSAKSEQVILKAIAHQARGEYLFRAGKLNQAKIDYDTSWKLFPNDINSRDYGFLAKWSGALELALGNKKKAKSQLTLALNILSNDRMRPTNILEVLFWMVQLNPKSLFNKYWVLNTHPSQIPYSYLTGRHCENHEGLHPWIRKNMNTRRDKSEVWSFHNGKVRRAQYSLVAKKYLNNTLDLVAGVTYGQSGFKTLTPLKARCLLALASSAYLGLSDWALIDYIYPDEWQIGPSMLVRLNDLIKHLRLEGYKIVRRKNQFFWFPPPKLRILFPMDHKVKGVFAHFRVVKRRFKRLDMEAIYGITPPTAKLWIKEWLEAGLINNRGAGRNTFYEFF